MGSARECKLLTFPRGPLFVLLESPPLWSSMTTFSEWAVESSFLYSLVASRLGTWEMERIPGDKGKADLLEIQEWSNVRPCAYKLTAPIWWHETPLSLDVGSWDIGSTEIIPWYWNSLYPSQLALFHSLKAVIMILLLLQITIVARILICCVSY